MRGRLLAVAAAISMISLSGGALAQSAAPLSLSGQVRTGAALDDANNIRGGFIIPTLVLIAIIGAIYLVTKNGDPESP